jgi:Phage integrase, N-terminal SAM-like domain
LAERGHGSWCFHCSVPVVMGGTERVRRGGFPSKRTATEARDELLARSLEEATAETWTVARWLSWWLSTRVSLRPSTLRSYTHHVEQHLIPHLGYIRLADLTGRDVADLFTYLSQAQAQSPTRSGRPLTPASLHRIRATLRAALNAAIRRGFCGTTRLATCRCRRRAGHRPWCGPSRGSRRGANAVSVRR